MDVKKAILFDSTADVNLKVERLYVALRCLIKLTCQKSSSFLARQRSKKQYLNDIQCYQLHVLTL
ncbi:unnamed protein product [Haemonchus placei]|uniref:Uncharacterized protein n=1 Tax=Haemonchus placei TaxID=6290 RepID=A0A3P7W4N5_HAEPC|nr:unnamed protein product [Haemonchus placei]